MTQEFERNIKAGEYQSQVQPVLARLKDLKKWEQDLKAGVKANHPETLVTYEYYLPGILANLASPEDTEYKRSYLISVAAAAIGVTSQRSHEDMYGEDMFDWSKEFFIRSRGTALQSAQPLLPESELQLLSAYLADDFLGEFALRSVVFALGWVGGQEQVACLENVLYVPDLTDWEDMRSYVLSSLHLIGGPRAREAMQRVAKNDDLPIKTTQTPIDILVREVLSGIKEYI